MSRYSCCRITISSKNIPPKITDFSAKVRQKITAELEGKMISLKVDGCSKNHRHFVGINVQYGGNDKDGPTVRTLAVEELFEAPTANNLRLLIIIVLKRFRIQTRQLVSFTTDSGANYVLAGKLLTEEGETEPTQNEEQEQVISCCKSECCTRRVNAL